jgi:septum site-determining protein MinD
MIAIAGGKGGCGKTTVTVGLARELARRGREPIVVDADLDMPDLGVRLDVDPTDSLAAVAGGSRLDRSRQRPPGEPGIGLLAGGDETDLAAALRRLDSWHDPVLIDCPAGAGPPAAVALRAAGATILVTSDTPQAVGDTRKTAAMARRLDAPPAAVFLRETVGGEGVAPPAVEAAVECAPVEPAPTVEDPAGDPRFRAACRALSERIAGQHAAQSSSVAENRFR